MRPEEAQWIEQMLLKHLIAPGASSPGVSNATAPAVVLNLGCGPQRSREVSKPFIFERTLKPLSDAGFRVVNSDMVDGPGVDLCGDLGSPQFQQTLAQLRPKLVYFCNILEHLPTPVREGIPALLARIVAPGGYLVLTVPHSYPYHADPIDTYYRPTPEELIAAFPGYVAVESKLVQSATYGDEFFASRRSRQVRRVLRLLFPFIAPRRWLSMAHRFFWLYRPYQQTCVLLRRPEGSTT